MKKILKKILTLTLVVTLSIQSGWAQGAVIPAGNILLPSDTFSLPVIRGMQFNSSEPLDFNFVVDLADESSISEEEALKLVRYFMAVLAVPEKDIWVNLSPDGAERIIAPNFGATEAGEDLLAQDLLLKRLSSSFLHPDQEIGRKFWDTAYKKIYEVYGLTEIPQDAFSRIWIVPQRAVIDEFKNAAYISESRLKVLMADEYEALKGMDRHEPSEADEAHARVAAIMKDIVLPEVEKQVNEGEHFAVLRQIYHSMILAAWFKTKLKDHLVNRVYSDSSKTEGIDLADKAAEEQTFDSYLNIFRNGLYDTIREDYDPVRQEMTVRKYVAGGYELPPFEAYGVTRSGNRAMLGSFGKTILLSVALFLVSSVGSSLLAQTQVTILPQTAKVLTLNQTIGSEDRPYLDVIRTFVTAQEVAGLKGQTNVDNNNKEFNFDAYLITRDGDKVWEHSAFNWKVQAYVVQAQIELKALGYSSVKINGKLDKATRDALQDYNSKKNTPNPTLPGGAGVDSLHQMPSGGAFQNADQQFQQTLKNINDSIAQANYADSIRQMQQMSWQMSFDSLEKKLEDRDSTIARLIAGQAAGLSGSGAPNPPPKDSSGTKDYFGLSFYNDMGGFAAGSKASGVPYQYGVIGGTYNIGKWTLLGDLETGYYLQGDTIAGATGFYIGGTYQLNPTWKFGAKHRFRNEGPNGTVTPLNLLTVDWTGKGYGLSGAVSFTNNFDPDAQAKVRQRAYMLSGYGSFGNLTVTPALYFMPNMVSDWSINLSYAINDSMSAFLERNASAAYAAYHYAPNAFWRGGVNRTLKNGNVLGFYLTNNSYDFNSFKNVGAGLTYKYTWTDAPSSPTAAPDPSLTTTPWTATFYTDGSTAGQYGQYSATRTWKNLVFYSLFETTVVPASEGAPAFTNVDVYNQVGFPFLQNRRFTSVLHLGLRKNVVGGTNGLTYIRASGNVGSRVSYDYWYSTGTTTDAETGESSNIRGNTFYITYTPTPWLSIAPTIITGKQGDKSFQDWGATVTGTYKGWQLSYAYNPVLGAQIGTVPDYTRLQLKSPAWTFSGTGTSIQAAAYVAVADRTEPFKGFIPGGTVSLGFGGPKAVTLSLSDKLKDMSSDSTSTSLLMKLEQLPDNAPTDTVKVGGHLFDFDVQLLGVLKELSEDDFIAYQVSIEKETKKRDEIEKIATRNYKKLLKELKKLRKYKGGPVYYHKDLGWGVAVAKYIFEKYGYYDGDVDGTINTPYRRAALTFENGLNQPTEAIGSSKPVTDRDGNGAVVQSEKPDKAMVVGDPNNPVTYGGVDLTATEDAMETRVHGTFEGLNNMDVNLINPETFRGFGVRLIGMRPIFDLSQIFTPDDSPVMISQL